MIKNYFIIAWRNLMRHKMYSFINIVGLSLGLATCMLIILYTKDEVSYDKFHSNANQIYRIATEEVSPNGEINKYGITGNMQGPTYKRLMPEVENFVRVQGEEVNIKMGTEIFTQDILKVDSSFFSVFPSFEFKEGTSKSVLRNPTDIVLSEEVAEKYFGKTPALGKSLSINYEGEFKTFKVSAVTKKSPQNSSIKIKLLMANHLDKDQDKNWVNFFLNTFLVLNKKADINVVTAKMNQYFANEAKMEMAEAKKNWGFDNKLNFSLQPLLDMHLSTDYPPANGLEDESNPIYSYILTGIAIFILIIACINFVNLTVARSLKRAKEIGVRKVIGGSRKLLIFQFLGESLLLSLLAFVLAIAFVQLVLPIFNTLANKSLSLSYIFNPQIIFGYITLFLVTGLLAGFYPALVLSGFKPVDTLYGKLKLSQGAFLQKGLVVLQFTLTGFLIVVTLVLYSQFNYLTTKDLGYNDNNIVKFRTGRLEKSKADYFSNVLLEQTSIQKVSGHNSGGWFTMSKIKGGQEVGHRVEFIDENYVSTFQLTIAMGRNFSKDMPSDTSSSILVNEAFVKDAGWKEPLGQTVTFMGSERSHTVVGVIKNYHFDNLGQTIKPQVFTCDPHRGSVGELCVRVDPKKIPEALQHIQKSFKTILPTRPYQYEFVSDLNDKQYEKESKWKQMISFAAILTIFISCIGLFGLATLSAEKRTKEIGIRKVLGASVMVIVRMLANQFLVLVFMACLISFPLAWWVGNKFLQDYPYRIEISTWMFVSALLITSVIAFLTIASQAFRAARANPVKSLRTE
jgi:putative ABC transport system permease protein